MDALGNSRNGKNRTLYLNEALYQAFALLAKKQKPKLSVSAYLDMLMELELKRTGRLPPGPVDGLPPTEKYVAVLTAPGKPTKNDGPAASKRDTPRGK